MVDHSAPADPPTNALTAEEWQQRACMRGGVGYDILQPDRVGQQFGPSRWDENEISAAERHALAALCLYQQAFGFDHSDLEWVLARCDDVDDVRVKGEEIAAKIRALLPPQP